MIGDLFDSPWKILIVAVVIIVLFGSRKLPDAARSLGKSMRILKKEVSSLHNDDEDPATHSASVPAAPVQFEVPAATAVPAVPAVPAATATPDAQAQIDALSQQLADLQQSVKAPDSAQAK
ncbi:MAG TPA: Sec-independent protein translocase subunit TatA [Trebonia sp.]